MYEVVVSRQLCDALLSSTHRWLLSGWQCLRRAPETLGAFREQAVVNEKTDDEATHRRLMLEMAEQANKADELGRIMIAKESELGVLENKLEVRRWTT